MRWADADEDDEDFSPSQQPGEKDASMFETKPDAQGIFHRYSYEDRDGKMYKVGRWIRQTKITT